MRLPIRSAAITLKDDHILLMQRNNQGRKYYVFPGGGVEDSESTEQAAIRETYEETSVNIAITRLLYWHHLIGDTPGSRDSEQYFYLARYLSGEPKLQPNTNEAQKQTGGNDFYQPLWFPCALLTTIKLYPMEVRDWLTSDLTVGFKDAVRENTWRLSAIAQ